MFTKTQCRNVVFRRCDITKYDKHNNAIVTYIKLLYGFNNLSGALIPPSSVGNPKYMFDNSQGHVTKG